MAYSSKTHKTSFSDLGERAPVYRLGQKSHGARRDAEMWVTETTIGGTQSTGLTKRRLYEIWIDGVFLPECPEHMVTVRLSSDTVKSRALTVAAFLLTLDRPLILDMVRTCLSSWSLSKCGVTKDGRSVWSVSDGTPLESL